MIRFSSINRIMARSRYIMDHRKPKVQQYPLRKLPKYVYETKYHRSADPGLDHGYPNHEHLNPWMQEGGNRFQQFRFAYAGEWWQGSFGFKLFLSTTPFIIYLLTLWADDRNKKNNNPSYNNSVPMDSFNRFIPPPRDMR